MTRLKPGATLQTVWLVGTRVTTGEKVIVQCATTFKTEAEMMNIVGKTCSRCNQVVKVDYEDCIAGKEVPGAGTEPHLIEALIRVGPHIWQSVPITKIHWSRSAAEKRFVEVDSE